MDVNPYESPKTAATTESSDVAPSLWNPDAAGIWSLFLTPIFGSTLVLMNWQAIGEEPRVRAGRIWLAVSVLMLIASSFVPALALIYIITWYFAWQRKQTRFVNERWGKDYPRKGWGVPLLIGIAGVAAFSVVFTLFVSLFVSL